MHGFVLPLIGIILILASLTIFIYLKKFTIEKINKQAQEKISALLEEAKKEAERIKKEAGEEAKERYKEILSVLKK